VKILALILCLAGLLAAADDKPGDFTIRFEPTAKLQTNVEVPFEVHVTDSRKRPLPQGQVELSISPVDKPTAETVKAWFVQPGLFIAKPKFPSDGQWSVTVKAKLGTLVSTRTIEFTVVQ
jgi:nitrogen fixation protein FixH